MTTISDNLAIVAMQWNIAVLEMTADKLNANGDESGALIYQLRADKLREKIAEIDEVNNGPWIPECPSCHKDSGSNQENCKTCFDSIPENKGRCHDCGELKGHNLDCYECYNYAKEAETYRDEW